MRILQMTFQCHYNQYTPISLLTASQIQSHIRRAIQSLPCKLMLNCNMHRQLQQNCNAIQILFGMHNFLCPLNRNA